MNLTSSFNHSQFDKYAAYLKSTGLSDASISRKLSSLATFQKFLIKKKFILQNNKVIHFSARSEREPDTNQVSPKVESTIKMRLPLSINRYFLLAALFIILTGLGYGLYSQTILKAKKNLAYSTAAAPASPPANFPFRVV